MPKSTTTNEILAAVNELSNNMDKRFDGVETRLDRVEARLDGVERKVNGMEATMVTKDYLDRKMADVKGYLVGAIKNEDNKVNALAKKLYQKKSLSLEGEAEIISLKPFPEKI